MRKCRLCDSRSTYKIFHKEVDLVFKIPNCLSCIKRQSVDNICSSDIEYDIITNECGVEITSSFY
jgi:hypothetical protein